MTAAETLIVMGVSGSGKSTVGRIIADALQRPFIDADDLHPQANKDKMRAGIPLDDADRAPWLQAVGEAAAAAAATGAPAVVACSALKRAYRDLLRRLVPALQFVYLDGDRAFIAARMAGRNHEFMPDALLDSQFAALEVPDSDELVIRVPLDADVNEHVQRLVIDPLRAGNEVS